jgi:hypothetical protein
MKWVVFVFFFVVLSVFSHALPISVEFGKENYFSGESVQGKLYIGDSVENQIRTNDFRLEWGGDMVSIFPTLKIFENFTYFYFDLPRDLSGNYSFIVEDVVYLDNGVLVEEDLTFDFGISEWNESLITIDPGVFDINLDGGNFFYLSLVNPSEYSREVNISTSDSFLSLEGNSERTLYSNSVNSFKFYISRVSANKEESSIFVEYDNFSYIIPVYLKNYNVEYNESIVTDSELNFFEDDLNISLEVGESKSGFVSVVNGFDSTLENVQITISDSLRDIVELQVIEIDSIGPGEVIKINIYVNELKNMEVGQYIGDLSLTYDGEVKDMAPFYISILGEEEIVDEVNITLPPSDDENEEEGTSRETVLLYMALFVVVVAVLIFIRYSRKKGKTNSFFAR